jgi:hypothetical protein
MADDELAAALAEIKHDHRQHVSVNFPAPGVCVSNRERWPCQAYRAAAAVEAALSAAAGWKRFAAEGDAQDECAGELRKVIAAALAGKGNDHG